MPRASIIGAHRLIEEGDLAYDHRDLDLACRKFAEAVELLSRGAGNETLAADICARQAQVELELDRPFDAAVACDRGLRLHRLAMDAGRAQLDHWMCGLYSGLSMADMGLLSAAEERLVHGAYIVKDQQDALASMLDALEGVRVRAAQVTAGDNQVLMEEIQRMTSLLGEEEAGYWIGCMNEMSRSPQGRAELVRSGFLEKEHQRLASPADVARRASVVALRYRINKRLIRHQASAGVLNGFADNCVLPTVLRNPSARTLMDEADCNKLSKDRIAVMDDVFSGEVMLQMKMEMQSLRSAALLQNDPNDVCNPRTESRYFPYGMEESSREFREKCPVSMQVIQRVVGLPVILEEELGLRLAVPQSIMVACYPPGASYKMHLDNYAKQGGHDDVPRKVTILLYCNHGWSKPVGGHLRAWAPFDQGHGPAQLIEPLSGRLVVFMSEEIWHEVTEAHEDRFALTLWIHDRDKVDAKDTL
eukprot:TRINITY_DN72711_c0_g1_i1.p1 TRINITY_DN72711_c0_g1~~TRINITY_DN72711_c0_g1_i1.p1  ORF type:complete len:475 (-),score=83.30 TRINITY_DN72711_c0_g1_i1:139-1563(-)